MTRENAEKKFAEYFKDNKIPHRIAYGIPYTWDNTSRSRSARFKKIFESLAIFGTLSISEVREELSAAVNYQDPRTPVKFAMHQFAFLLFLTEVVIELKPEVFFPKGLTFEKIFTFWFNQYAESLTRDSTMDCKKANKLKRYLRQYLPKSPYLGFLFDSKSKTVDDFQLNILLNFAGMVSQIYNIPSKKAPTLTKELFKEDYRFCDLTFECFATMGEIKNFSHIRDEAGINYLDYIIVVDMIKKYDFGMLPLTYHHTKETLGVFK